MSGKYATVHDECGGRGCASCSTYDDHSIVGRVLCKYCGGARCDKCHNTGLYLRECRNCHGTGERVRLVPLGPPQEIEAEIVHHPGEEEPKKPAKRKLVNVSGKSDEAKPLGSVGDALVEQGVELEA